MKGLQRKTINYPLWAVFTLGVITVALVGAMLMSKPKTNVLPLVQGNPTITVTPTNTPVEATPVKVKELTKKVYITSAKRTLTFHYPETSPFEATYSLKDKDGFDTDAVVFTSKGKEIMKIGIDWAGYTGGVLPIHNVVKIDTRYLGNLSRYQIRDEVDDHAWGYGFTDSIKMQGKCGKYTFVAAPCMENPGEGENISVPKFRYMAMMIFCFNGNQNLCDTIIKGLEVN